MGEDQNKKSRPGKWVYSLHNRDLIRETGLQLKTGSWLYLILGLFSALALKTNKSLRHRAGLLELTDYASHPYGDRWVTRSFGDVQPEQLVQPVKHIHTTCATCASCATCTLQQVELGGWLRNCQQDERHVNVVFEQDKRGEVSSLSSCWVTP